MVAFSGTAGAYTEDAAIRLYGEESQRVPCRVFEDVFKSVLSGSADVGVVPVENSTTGTVKDVADLLLKYDLQIGGEAEVPVRHCLLTLPGVREEEIDEVLAHPQSLMQSDVFLAERPGWRQTPMLNNAFAARAVRARGERRLAAIASERCGKIYGLDPLYEGINSSGINATRFFAVMRDADRTDEKETRKCSVSFLLPHEPGALYHILGVFNDYQINMTRIESRPSGEANWEYRFFVDFQGVFTEEKLDEVIKNLISRTSDFQFLGCYPVREEASEK